MNGNPYYPASPAPSPGGPQNSFDPFGMLQPVNGGGSLPAPMPGSTMAPLTGQSASDRIQIAGGLLGQQITPNNVTPLEALFRILPEPGVYTATPSKPVSIVLGTLQVPENMVFVLLDWRFDIYRPSGVIPGDFVPLEDRRLSTMVGWDITVNGMRKTDYRMQILPVSPTTTSQTAGFEPNNPGSIPGQAPQMSSLAQFAKARTSQQQAPTGAAGSLLPQRHYRDGLMHVPYSWVLTSSERLAFSVKVLRAVPIPLAFFEVNFTGILVPQLAAQAFIEHTRLSVPQSGGV